MAASNNVELEAAKFLHKLIQDSKDEPAKLAAKLYVILQHMKSSGKEDSMPYQVISRAMETVINQNGLDIESLKSSRLPLSSGTQIGDSSTAQCTGSSSQAVGVVKDSMSGLAESETSKIDPFSSSRPPVGPSGAGHDYYQAAGTHRRSQSFDHESPSSLDSRSANSQLQERQKDGKKAKRKRGDSSISHEPLNDNPQQLVSHAPVVNPRKGKMNKVDSPLNFSVKGAENSNMVLSGGQIEHFSTLSGNTNSILRVKQEGQNITEKSLDLTNISNTTLRTSNLKFPEEVEVSSSGQQQGNSLSSANDALASRGMWNQNRVGFPFERSQVPRFPGNMLAETPLQQPTVSSLGANSFGKVHGGMSVGPSAYPMGELGSSTLSPVESQLFSTNRSDETSAMLSSGKVLEREGNSNILSDANKVSSQNSIPGTTVLRSAASRDTGKSSVPPTPAYLGMPFKEQQLKQLRAQCLVFLAFRNGLVPKKLHLEIALGNIFPREGGSVDGSRREMIDTVKAQSSNSPSGTPGIAAPFGRFSNAMETDRISPVASSSGRFLEADTSSKEVENLKVMDKSGTPADHSVLAEERKQSTSQSQEIAESYAFLTSAPQQPDSLSTRGSLAITNSVSDMENDHLFVGRANAASSLTGINKLMNTEISSWTGIGSQKEVPRRPLPVTTVQHELVKDNAASQFQSYDPSGASGNQYADSRLSSISKREQWKPVTGSDSDRNFVIPAKDASGMLRHMSPDDLKFSDGSRFLLVDSSVKNGIPSTAEQDEEGKSMHNDAAPSPKYTMSEKWIMDMQKRKLLVEQSWIRKQQKTKQRISTCFNKLKEKVSSSEDISAKTKSVIELKKLQLLGLQRRLRSDILNDFFKPITTDMDRLKSYKKHRHGRRIKQLEKFELKMKEERQKRIRERQKEFFSEIEAHKERLEEVFKIKRERWRGVTKYVKEFHKRKERVHREKIDRIQREKINLLKINDVEGYLRMVQDAKSDRVNKLLKETEKYLQKLGSKLQEAKSMASCFENEMDETSSIVEKYEPVVDNEDESDQAKHYLESNEKYYLMAHSVKESISEQPTCLLGGKLREYQMNGLRWLVSLYNNHLNGILADEMGLGKTVQVIALICYLMETKNDRGPFLVVVPSSVLPGWESEINLWAPSIHKIVYAGPPEERRKLFKEKIVHQKFNVLLTTYEYLMNKHDRPKLSKVQWHYIIIDEGHRIKNASCKLNADLKHYRSYHRLLLTGTPLQNNLEELWALLNFLLPNIFNSSEDFSQWFNKPFESNGDSSLDEALLSEEENLLIINRLHQVLRPFVLRRLKHKVENQLPEKIERLIRCEASAYQMLLMKRVEENLGSIGNPKARSVHNSVMELRNICNHPYLSQLHAEEVDTLIPKHYLPPIIRLCGKLEMLDRLLPKLKATDHRVLFFSTMTRLLDVMEDYLTFKQYRYLRLDGHTSGGDRGALIEKFNQSDSPFFIFLLSIRAGGVGVNLQAADTVIIFDTDWNPQVDLQAQARAHRIGQKRDVLVLRFETVQTVEEQVRASAEHKLGVANQSITAGFFDNNTSAEDRREYLESLLRESKKEEAAPVLDDDALNDILARSESEIDVFESVDKRRREEEMATWRKLVWRQGMDGSEPLPPLPSRLVTDDDLKAFYEAMKIYDVPKARVSPNVGVKRKGESVGALDMQQYGRGKRAREVRSYEEQWTEEEFEKMCQAESPDSPKSPSLKEEGTEKSLSTVVSSSKPAVDSTGPPGPLLPPSPLLPPATPLPPPLPSLDLQQLQQSKEVTPPSKRGRGRPRRVDKSPVPMVLPATSGASKNEIGVQRDTTISHSTSTADSLPGATIVSGVIGSVQHVTVGDDPGPQSTISSVPVAPSSQPASASPSIPMQPKGRGRRIQVAEQVPRRRGRKIGSVLPAVSDGLPSPVPDPKTNVQHQSESMNPSGGEATAVVGTVSSIPTAAVPDSVVPSARKDLSGTDDPSAAVAALNSEVNRNLETAPQPSLHCSSAPMQTKGQSRKTASGGVAPRRRGSRPAPVSPSVSDVSAGPESKLHLQSGNNSGDLLVNKSVSIGKQEALSQKLSNKIQTQPSGVVEPVKVAGPDQKPVERSDFVVQSQQGTKLSATHDSGSQSAGPTPGQVPSMDLVNVASDTTEVPGISSSKGGALSHMKVVDVVNTQSSEEKACSNASKLKATLPAGDSITECYAGGSIVEGASTMMHHDDGAGAPRTRSISTSAPAASQSTPPEASVSVPLKRHGRKTPITGEAPRRRGRKQGSVPSNPDGSVGLDTKLNQLSPNKSRDSIGNKTISLRSKQETADVNDVARVMKEIFSETCSSKAKTGDSWNEGKDASIRAVFSSSTISEVARKRSSDDKTPPVMPTGETTPGFDPPIDKKKEQLGTKNDASVKGEHTPVSGHAHASKIEAFIPENKSDAGCLENLTNSSSDDKMLPLVPNLETTPPGFDIPTQKSNEQSMIRIDAEVKDDDTLLSGEASAFMNEPFKQERKIDASSVNNFAGSSLDDKTCPLMLSLERAPGFDIATLERAPGFDVPFGKDLERSGSEIDAEVKGEDNPLSGVALASETEASKPENNTNVGSVKNLANNVDDHSQVKELIHGTVDLSDVKQHHMIGIVPVNTLEVSSEVPLEIPYIMKSTEGPSVSMTADVVAVHSRETPILSGSPVDSGIVEPSGTECSLGSVKTEDMGSHPPISQPTSASTEHSDPQHSVVEFCDKYEIPLMEVEAAKCSSDTIVKSPLETPLNIKSIEGPTIAVKADAHTDHSMETAVHSGSPVNSGAVEPSGSEGPPESLKTDDIGNHTHEVLSTFACPSQSFSVGFCENSGTSSIVADVAACSSEAIAENPLENHLSNESIGLKVSVIADEVADRFREATGRSGSPVTSGLESPVCDKSDPSVEAEVAVSCSETMVESHGVLAKANDPGISLEKTEVAANCNIVSFEDSHDKSNVEALSGGTADKAHCVKEPDCLVNMDMVPRDGGIERSSCDIKVCDMELDPAQASSSKDAIAEFAKVDVIPEDNGNMQLLLGVEYTEGDEIAKTASLKDSPDRRDMLAPSGGTEDKEDCVLESVCVVVSEPANLEMVLRNNAAERRDGDINVFNKEVDQSNVPLSSDDIIAESAEVEIAPDDHGKMQLLPEVKNTEVGEIAVTASLNVLPDEGVVEILAGESGDKADCILEPVCLVATESANMEMVPKDDGFERRDGDNAVNMEVDPSNCPSSSSKDIVTESSVINFVPDDHGETQVLSGVENIVVAEIANTASLNDLPDKGVVGILSGESGDKAECMPDPVYLVANESANLEMVPVDKGVERRDGNLKVYDIEVDPSNGQASSSTDIVAVSAELDTVLDDHGKKPLPLGVANIECGEIVHKHSSENLGEKVDVSSDEGAVGSLSVLQESITCETEIGDEIVTPEVDGSSPRSICGVVNKSVDEVGDSIGVSYPSVEKIEVDNNPVSSVVMLEDLKRSIGEAGDQIDGSQDGGVTSEISSDSCLPSSSLVPEEAKPDHTSVKDTVSRPGAEAGDRVGVSVVLEKLFLDLVTVEEKTEGPNNDPVTSLAPVAGSNESVVEADNQIGDSLVGAIVPEKLCVGLGMPPSSFATEEEKIEGSSKDPVSILAGVEDSKPCVAEAADQMGASVKLSENLGLPMGVSESSVVVIEKKSDDDLGLPPSSSATGEKNIEGSSEKDPVNSSVTLEDAKGFEAKSCDQPHAASQGDGAVQETVQEGKFEEEKIEVSSVKQPVGSSVLVDDEAKGPEAEPYEQMDVEGDSIVQETDPEESAVADEKISGSSEKEPVASPVSLDESKRHDAETNKTMGAEGRGGSLENVPQSSLAIEEEKMDGPSQKEPVGSSISQDESKEHDAEAINQTDIVKVGGSIVPEAVPEEPGVEEEKTERSQKEPVGSSDFTSESKEPEGKGSKAD